jgi:putative phosphoribosyl transferase
MSPTLTTAAQEQQVRIPWQDVWLDGDLALPRRARGIVLFAHGSGSSRHSSRNRHVAQTLQQAEFATLLMDLLTRDEEVIDMTTRRLRFDIDLLAQRLLKATDWLREQEATRELPIGYFGASTGAGAALVAAADRPEVVRAVVSRGGRPDLAGSALPRVYAPTLLIVGGHDFAVIPLNQQALELIGADESRLEIVPNATHLFEEPGTLEQVARLAAEWFQRHLPVTASRG